MRGSGSTKQSVHAFSTYMKDPGSVQQLEKVGGRK